MPRAEAAESLTQKTMHAWEKLTEKRIFEIEKIFTRILAHNGSGAMFVPSVKVDRWCGGFRTTTRPRGVSRK